MVERTVLLCLEGELEADLVQLLQAHPYFAVARRCADLIELTAAATAGLGSIAVLEDTAELSRAVVSDLLNDGLDVVALGAAERATELTDMGVSLVITQANAGSIVTGLEGLEDLRASIQPTEAASGTVISPAQLEDDHVADLLSMDPFDEGIEESAQKKKLATRFPSRRAGGANAADDSVLPFTQLENAAEEYDSVALAADVKPLGRVVAVRGTEGAPGRSTLALLTGIELGRSGKKVIIVDGDLSAPSLGLMAGARPEWAGIAVACRMASRGRLDIHTLSRLLHATGPDSLLLSGISRAERWREVHPEDLTAVLDEARKLADYVIVDTAAWLPDESDDFDVAIARETITARIVAAADQVVTVAPGNPVGISRLVALLEDSPCEEEVLVVNRVSSASSGPAAEAEIRSIVEPLSGGRPLLLIWEDEAIPTALLQGVALPEVRKSERSLTAIQDLISLLSDEASMPAKRAFRWAFWRRHG
ncbi:hypothetical protein BM477_02010 [Boudabousia marimammalium]|uniref:CobQ/CobB/MinD/ParA nucleotide binding domain-containing protein n=2 Tax=Boudabousia marimammalium TaxID=156892 RepID=A0A1Q5PRF6_9ACTO|nr:hypothetical protein BM477_02010 [Boudabousia marimammalium]